MNMNERRVLISGASIAGLACAYWLRRHGFSVTIVEIAPSPRPGGQAVDLRGAGRTVIDRMGLLNGARAIGLEQAGDFLASLGIGRSDLTDQERERALAEIEAGLVALKRPFHVEIRDVALVVRNVPDELGHLHSALK